MKKHHKVSAAYLVCYIGFGLLAFVCLAPFLLMMLNATQAHADLSTGIQFLPGKSLLANYATMQSRIDIWLYLRNSLAIAVPGILLTAYLGTLAAYGFEKFNFPCKNLLFGITMGMMVIPQQISLIGLYQMYADLRLLDTFWTCILPSAANVLTVYWMRSFIYQVIDNALLESATIDGCGEFAIFNRIVLPLCKTGIMTISIMNFVALWNDYINPLTYITSKSKYTLPLGIAFMKQDNFVDLGAVYLAIAISTLAILVIYIAFNAQIVGNVTEGSVKG